MRSIMFLFTIILGMGVTAWALNDNKATEQVLQEILEKKEWHFNGAPDPLNNNIENPAQYSQFASESCDGVEETVCKINAPALPSNSGQPDLNAIVTGTGQTVKQRIALALSTKMPNETVAAFRSE